MHNINLKYAAFNTEICSFVFLNFILLMKKFPRFDEYKVVVIRILLAYLFYSIARVLFFIYNSSLIKVDGVIDFLKLCYHGLVFDTTAIIYINSLFIIASIIPAVINTRKSYQKVLFYIYFATNLVAYSTNLIAFIFKCIQ